METLHKNIFKQPFFWTSICSLLALGILVGFYSYAWIAPTASPNSNTGAAINFYNSNVGIGTSTPSDKLHLYGTNVAVKVEATSNTAGLQLKSAMSDWFVYTFGTKFGIKNVTNAIWPFTIEATAPTNSFAIDGTGNVGIGTTAPGGKLHIMSDNTAAGSDRSNQLVIQGSTNTNYKLNVGIYTSASPAYADIGFVEDGVAWRNIVLARSGGNVGIGTSAAPGEKLEVAGKVKITGTGNGIIFPDATVQTTAASAGAVRYSVGESAYGGTVAYIFKSGETGYVSGEQHGLIAAAADQSTSIIWAVSAYQNTAVPGADGVAIGTGAQNTIDIVAQNGVGSTFAAGLCSNLSLNAYTDWYLPSDKEAATFLSNLELLNLIQARQYWDSTEYGAAYANALYLSPYPGAISPGNNKSGTWYVRCVRNF